MAAMAGRRSAPSGVLRTSSSWCKILSGIGSPRRNMLHSFVKWLQLCVRRLYVSGVKRCWISCRKSPNTSGGTSVCPSVMTSTGCPAGGRRHEELPPAPCPRYPDSPSTSAPRPAHRTASSRRGASGGRTGRSTRPPSRWPRALSRCGVSREGQQSRRPHEGVHALGAGEIRARKHQPTHTSLPHLCQTPLISFPRSEGDSCRAIPPLKS